MYQMKHKYKIAFGKLANFVLNLILFPKRVYFTLSEKALITSYFIGIDKIGISKSEAQS